MTRAGKRVLITGINGFTGRYMAEELRQYGYEVFGTGHTSAAGDNYRQVDLLDVNALRGVFIDWQPEVVVHLAALAFVGHGNPDEFYEVNVIGTRHLLELITECVPEPECILLASSANIYGNSSAGLIDEETSASPANDYAVSKLAMEYMASLWKQRLPLVIVRPFNYTGVGQSPTFLLPKIVDHFRRRADLIELGNLDVYRDFSDVRTVVGLYRRFIEARGAVGQTFNISSGVSHSLRDLIDLCSQLTGHVMEVKVNPKFVRDGEVKTLCGDTSKARRTLGEWDPIPIRETLKWMLGEI